MQDNFKHFFHSQYLTYLLFLLGLILFAIIFPSLLSANGDNFRTTIAAIYGGYLSFFFGVYHFFWRKDSRQGFKKFVFPFIKAFSLCFLLVSMFLTYQYYFGSIYGGKKYQRKVRFAVVKMSLADYYYQQMDQIKYTRSYDLNLHKTERFQSKNFTIGVAGDDPFIKEKCPDCIVTKDQFKVAVYLREDDEILFATVNNHSKVDNKLNVDFVLGNQN